MDNDVMLFEHGKSDLKYSSDPANSNSVISNSSLFRTKSHFAWTFPSCSHLLSAISNYSFSLKVRNFGVQL